MNDYPHHLDDYDYELPADRIAQFPAPERDRSRLLVLDTTQATLAHHQFADIIDKLRESDLLVINNTKVFPARLLGHKQTGGKVELFLLSFPQVVSGENLPALWREATAPALIKSSKRPKPGDLLNFSKVLRARIDSFSEDGKAQVTLQYHPLNEQTLEALLEAHGQMPLPPYINRPDGCYGDDLHRYQTRYARHTGSVAAPTAGLHFSDDLLAKITAKGIDIVSIMLHVGYGTFAPVRTEDIREHVIHQERVEVSAGTAEKINRVKAAGGRIWAVGTTTVRTLEFAADEQGQIHPLTGECDLFIYPGFQFRIVDNLITNFHLPKSSLLFLVSALAGHQRIMAAYQEAVAGDYRFFSYGDAMAIITKS
ncbi:MAG: tRNA preQ1(34) S-adenosylmethionine ribosyltransferase-isomerase QueA [Desulfobulbaceae bacterium]|nr:tRNA preQ1(34) S-adenosylmethionine ribosyltransferase-isomerase QueA [Desulfobulbaceae bacterium]